MDTFTGLLAFCEGNSPATGEFPSQRPVTRSNDGFFDLRLDKQLNEQSRRRRLETPSHPLWRHGNDSKWSAVHAGGLYNHVFRGPYSIYFVWLITGFVFLPVISSSGHQTQPLAKPLCLPPIPALWSWPWTAVHKPRVPLIVSIPFCSLRGYHASEHLQNYVYPVAHLRQ